MFKNYAELDFGDGPQAAVAPKSAMFSPHGVDTFSALGKVKFMDIPETELYQFFSDGRITGLLTDQMLNARYKNLSAMRSGNNKGFDLYQNAGDGATPHKPFLWETKVWTKHGCDLAPSGMKGKNRKYNEDEFNANANTLTGGFIVVDIRNFPIMRVFGITAEKHAELGRPRKVTDDIFHRILKGPSAPVTKAAKAAKTVDPKKFMTGTAKTGWTLAIPGAPVLTIAKEGAVYAIRAAGKKKPLSLAGTAAAAKAEAIQLAQAKAVIPDAPAKKTPAKKAPASKTPKAVARKKAPAKSLPTRKVAATKTPKKKAA